MRGSNYMRELLKNHKGNLTDRWSSYTQVYENFLASKKEATTAILEVGVQNGGSLEIWAKYFPSADRIVGLDINDKIRSVHFQDARIEALVLDATKDEAKSILVQKFGSKSFDLIIDDGSHISGHILRTLENFWELLSDNGVYIIEDLHCSYWKFYKGGLNKHKSAVTRLADIADAINHEHWRLKPVDVLVQYIKSYYRGRRWTKFLQSNHSTFQTISFHNSMAVIQKCPPNENALGAREQFGNIEAVTENLRKIL